MKRFVALLFVLIGLNSHAFIHTYIHVIPDYESCSGELDFAVCNEFPFTYIMTYNGIPVNSTDFPLTNQCATGVNTLYFIASNIDDGTTYEFEANISFSSSNPSISYSIEPLVRPLSVIQTHQVSTSMCNGQISLTVDGGYAPITTNWYAGGAPLPSPPNPFSLENICPGDYGYSIMDNYQHCGINPPLIRPVTIDFFECLVYATDITCHGECDGNAFLMLMGSQNIQYSMLTHGMESNPMYLSDLCAGMAMGEALHVTGTMTTCQAMIFEPALINFNFSATDATGFGLENGTAEVNITAGNGSYVYDWIGDNDFEDLNGGATQTDLAAGDYSLTITYNNGCDTTITFVIGEPNELIITITNIQNQTTIQPNGAVEFDVDGGVEPYLVQITYDGTTTEGPFDGLVAGEYELSVEDANGNFVSESFEILAMVVGLKENSTQSIQVYPNPIDNFIKIIGNDIKSIELVNSLGQSISQFEGIDSSETTIDTSTLISGIYFVRMRMNSGETVVRKLVKK